MANDSVLRKIEKCLALSKSSNEHEAAAALRQAQKLMQAHDIEMRDVEEARIADIDCDLPIQAGKKVPEYMVHFLWLIEKAFGVRSSIHRTIRVSDPSFTIRYYGTKARTECAAYAHDVVYRAALRGWEAYRNANAGIKFPVGVRSSYLIGFFENIKHGLPAFEFQDGEKQLLDTYVDNKCEGRKSKLNEARIDEHALRTGAKAGKNFQLRQGVGANDAQLKLE